MANSRKFGVVALALAAVAAVTLFSVDAFAATSVAANVASAFPISFHDLVVMATPLAALRASLADLEAKALAKKAEIKDGLAAEDLRRIEGEHAGLLREIADTKTKIVAAEVEERNAPPAGPDAAALRAAGDEAVRVDRERAKQIREIGAKLKLDDKFINDHATGNTSVDAFRALAIDHLAAAGERSDAPGGGRQTPVIERISQDETVTRREAMVDYIYVRYGQRGAMTDAARQYRGMNAVDLIREVMSWQGEAARGMTPDEIAQRGLMTTSDFPAILSAVANKTLRASYTESPRTFKSWTRNITLTDFNLYNIVRRGETPQLAKLNEKGEYKRGQIAESKETIKLETYGIVVGMTRQLIINDSLGAMVTIPADFANSAARLESDIVYAILLNSPAMKQDGVALFDAAHKNLAAAGTALDLIPISKGRTAMSKQVGVDGKTVLALVPDVLIVPTDLQTKAEQLQAQITAAKSSDVVPESLKRLTPVAEPRLSIGVNNTDAGVSATGSATAFYMASTQVDTILTANLEGQDGPYIESRVGFDVDGVEIKCRHDFAAAAGDFRGLYKDPGAA